MTQDCTAILILTYNSASDTINCIRSIEACNSVPVKYIVVDNGSPDKSESERLDSFFTQSGRSYRKLNDSDTPGNELPYFTFLASCENDGYARGNNKGLNLAYGDPSIRNILVLNSDILFTEDILPTLLSFQQQQTDCGLITPLIVSRKGAIDHCCARRSPSNWEVLCLFGFFRRDFFHILSRANHRQKILRTNPDLTKCSYFPIDMPSGACMLIDKELFRQIGSFDPNTFLYYEENILYKKLAEIFHTNYCVPTVKCTHLGATSTQNVSSIFLQRCNLESADHYLRCYGHLTFCQRMVWGIIKSLWLLKFKVTETPKKD